MHRAHPAFAGGRIPRQAVLDGFHLRVLHPAEVEEDFRAVTETAGDLRGLMGGDWPVGLTLEANLWDLAWHLREFEAERSFAWIVGDAGGAYLGCAYVFPAFADAPAAQAAWWMRASAAGHGPRFGAAFARWLASPPWPEGMAVTVRAPAAQRG